MVPLLPLTAVALSRHNELRQKVQRTNSQVVSGCSDFPKAPLSRVKLRLSARLRDLAQNG